MTYYYTAPIWFSLPISILKKHRHSFISFDIVDFYPSISENLPDQALSWASNLAIITKDEISIIKHARKSVLFNDGKPWTKKDSNSLFDVTMGSYDRVEICELLGLFILNKLGQKFGKENIGLYRDDGLAITKSKSARLADKTRKDPPFSKNVKTNIAGNFLCLIDKHFPPNHKLHKIFNRNTVKVSYSCMNNVKSIISKHNTRITGKSKPQCEVIDPCTCRDKKTCPLQEKCMTKDIVYKATVTTSNTNSTKHYIGMTASTFKERLPH